MIESNNFLKSEDQKTVIGGDTYNATDLLTENLKYAKAIYEDTQRIRRYMFLRMILSIIWLVLVVTPILFAIFYLPPFIEEFYRQFNDFIGEGRNGLDLLNQLKNL